MGRYYYDQTGKEGKFWFAVQPSTDPADIYDMNEVEPDSEWAEDSGYNESYVDYDGCDAEHVKEKLDEQYNLLGVPKDERAYKLDDEGGYVWENLSKYYLTYKEPPKEDGQIPCGYHMGDDKPTAYPISKEKELAASRVQLGLFIYNSILRNGSCFMTAEL